MGLLLIILSAAAIGILAFTFFEKYMEDGCIAWIIIAVISIILAMNGTVSECRDGWHSYSIGRSGACSWHGGVVTRYNDFGKNIATISGIIIGIKLLRVYFQEKSKEQ